MVAVVDRKSERILNLTICLLATRRFLTRRQIRAAIEGYAEQSESTFERTFERDKEDLRAMGVPVQTGSTDRFFEDEVGYRIDPRDFELPPVDLTAAEAAVVGLAARAFDAAGAASSSQGALAKLRAAGADVDQPSAAGVVPAVPARQQAFEPVWRAAVERNRITFAYPDSRTGKLAARTVEPWAIVSRRGAWYVIGHDADRGERRVFKLSRIAGDVSLAGRPGAFTIPEDADLSTVGIKDSGAERTAKLAIRPGRAPALRRRGQPITEAGPSLAAPALSGRDLVAVQYRNSADLVAELAGHGADVVVLDPPELRAHVVHRLQHTAGLGRGA